MKALGKLPVIPLIAILLGAFLLTEFYTHLALGRFAPETFSEALHSLAAQDQAPRFWKEGLLWAGRHNAFFAPFCAPALGLTAVCLLLLLIRPVALWAATGIFLLYWVSNWAYPGIWIFEFLFPLAFAFCAACASAQEGVLGSKLFGSLKRPWKFLIVVLSACALWYVVFLGKNAGEHTVRVAWQTSLSFLVLFGLSALLDSKRRSSLQESRWVAVMILTVGAMMTLQVFADQAVGFYTEEGYADLVNSYAKESSAPEWFKAFLSWSADYAALFMPLQAVFEAVAAILLSLLILRGPALFCTALMFLVFTYAEFGVKAELPSSPVHTLTNTWELLFVTIASLFISLKEIAQLSHASGLRQKILGPPLFGDLSLMRRLALAALGGGALFAAGVKTHVFHDHYLRTSWFGGIAFALLLMFNALIDPARKRDV